jgi:hypothetical protein
MSIPTKKPVNYLNNKDILKEIHTSKNAYCAYLDRENDHKYDFIVDMPHATLQESFEHALKPETIQLAREARAARMDQEQGLPKGTFDPQSIPVTDLIFRVMTWEHIPVAPKQPRKVDKKKTAKDIFEFEDEGDDILAELEDPTTKGEVDDMVHVKVNFPPFQHFRLDNNNSFRCIGKSHWVGDLETGEFSKDHGNITDKLARMYIMMCEKYAMKFNWRGYTYNDEMRNSAILQLTYVGLRFNEAKSANPFAYYTAAITNSFCRVLNSEKRNQNIRDDILEINGLNPSWTRQGMGSGSVSFEE